MRMDQRHGAKHGREGTRGEHKFDNTEIEVALEQPRLKLARK